MRSVKSWGRKENSDCDAERIFRLKNHAAFSTFIDGSVVLRASCFMETPNVFMLQFFKILIYKRKSIKRLIL